MRFRKPLTHLNYSRKGLTLIEPLLVIGLLGILAAVAIPNIIDFINRGEDETELTEKDDVQLVVQLMLIDADEEELDDDYDAVKTLPQIQQVTAGESAYNPGNYLYVFSGSNQFAQAYNISEAGVITVD